MITSNIDVFNIDSKVSGFHQDDSNKGARRPWRVKPLDFVDSTVGFKYLSLI